MGRELDLERARQWHESRTLHHSDFPPERLRAERAKLSDFRKLIVEALRKTRVARALTEGGKMDKDELARIQERVTKDTEAIARELEKEAAPGGEKTKNHVNNAAKNQQSAAKNIGRGKVELSCCLCRRCISAAA